MVQVNITLTTHLDNGRRIDMEIDASDWGREAWEKFYKWHDNASDEEIAQVMGYCEYVDNDIWDAMKYATDKIIITPCDSIESYIESRLEQEGVDVSNTSWLLDNIDYSEAFDSLQVNHDDYGYTPYYSDAMMLVVEVVD